MGTKINFSITDTRLFFGTGLSEQAATEQQKRELLQKYGFNDLEIAIILIEYPKTIKTIVDNEPLPKKTRKTKAVDPDQTEGTDEFGTPIPAPTKKK